MDARNNLQDINPHIWTLGLSCNAQGTALLKYKKGSYFYDCGGVTFGLEVFVLKLSNKVFNISNWFVIN